MQRAEPRARGERQGSFAPEGSGRAGASSPVPEAGSSAAGRYRSVQVVSGTSTRPAVGLASTLGG
jgi:hypothetical protein